MCQVRPRTMTLVRNVAVTDDDIVSPITVGGEVRDIGNVAHTIGRVTQDTLLPGRLGVSQTGAADNPACRGHTGRATAGPPLPEPVSR